MSTTPRTDAKECESDKWPPQLHAHYGWKFARTLEQELSAANERAQDWKSAHAHVTAQLDDALAKLAMAQDALQWVYDHVADDTPEMWAAVREALEATREAAHAHVLDVAKKMCGDAVGMVLDHPDGNKRFLFHKPMREGTTPNGTHLYALPADGGG